MKRIRSAFFYSLQGLRIAWQEELSFKQEVMLLFILTPLASYLAPTRIALLLMLSSCGLVLIVELLNSALEATIDRISPENHPLSKKAKDLGSAAVFIALCLTVMTWMLLLV